MDQNMNMGTPMPEEKSSVGIIISIVVVVLVLAFGAYYFLKQGLAPQETTGTPATTEASADATVTALSAQGTSTNIADIEMDLKATDIPNVNVGLSDVSL